MKFYLSLTKPYNNLTTAIAGTIKQFYPIGITMDEPGYAEHPGIIKGIQLMEDNIGNDKNYQKRWVSFTDKLAKELGKK